jgi:hypothetical protein
VNSPLPPALSALTERLGLTADDLDEQDTLRATRALDDAATLVLAEVPAAKASLWEADAPKVVVLLALKAARREFENPSGFETESLGEHSVGLSETSGVYLTGRSAYGEGDTR